MIHKLRRKFIFIITIIVMLLLTGVLAAVWIYSFQHQETEIRHGLERALEISQKEVQLELEPPDGGTEPRKLATSVTAFAVDIYEDGSYELTYESGITPSDDLLESAIAAAVESGSSKGNLRRLSLRFAVHEDNGFTRIAFVDTLESAVSLGRLAAICILTLAVGTLILFGISCFLARWTLRPVEEAWDQQNQFIADISHELKTPLTVILANLKIVMSHKGDTISSQEHWLKNTQLEAESMKNLVEELLFLARSDAKMTSSEKTDLNLSDLALSTLLLFEPVAYEQGVTLEHDIAPQLTVNADLRQMQQLIAILLDNACKYAGKEKRVTLILSRQKGRVCLTVQNTGNRIPSDELSRLFVRFYRSDKSRSHSTKDGYGLGLSIAQAIVQEHGGKISAESTDEITSFIVSLPLK